MLNLLIFLSYGDKDRKCIWADCDVTQWVTLWRGRLGDPMRAILQRSVTFCR